MKHRISLIIATCFLFAVYGCDRIAHKSEEVSESIANKTKEVLTEQGKRVVHKVYPPFDHNQPDTENNKARFIDFLSVEVTDDVKNIYCFDDAIGIDADYMFAFNCNAQTAERIIETNRLAIDTLNRDNAFSLQDDFEWWDKDRIAKLQKYSWTNGKDYYKYFWYDQENEKAYFFDFDL